MVGTGYETVGTDGLTEILRDMKGDEWSTRLQGVEAFALLLQRLAEVNRAEGGSTANSPSPFGRLTRKALGTFLDSLQDPHYRVMQGAMAAIHSLLQAARQVVLGDGQAVEEICAVVFAHLGDSNTVTRNQAEHAVATLRAACPPDALLPPVLHLVQSTTPRLRSAALETVYSILVDGKGEGLEWSAKEARMRLVISRTLEAHMKQPDLLRTAQVILESLYKWSPDIFIQACVSLEPERHRQIEDILAPVVHDMAAQLQAAVKQQHQPQAQSSQGRTGQSDMAPPQVPSMGHGRTDVHEDGRAGGGAASPSTVDGWSQQVSDLLRRLEADDVVTRREALHQVAHLSSRGPEAFWPYFFSQVAMAVVMRLNDPEGVIQESALAVIRRMLRYQPQHIPSVLEMLLGKLISAKPHCSRVVGHAVDKTLDLLTDVVRPMEVLKVVIPAIQHEQDLVLHGAIRVASRVIPSIPAANLNHVVDAMLPGLFRVRTACYPSIRATTLARISKTSGSAQFDLALIVTVAFVFVFVVCVGF